MLAMLLAREFRCDCQRDRARKSASMVLDVHRQSQRLLTLTWLSIRPRLHTRYRSDAEHPLQIAYPPLIDEYQVHRRRTIRRHERGAVPVWESRAIEDVRCR